MAFVKKPTEGFHTPYQTLVDGFANYMIKQIHPTSPNYENWVKTWTGLDENNCDISEPVWNEAKGNWKIDIQSPSTGIRNEVPLAFTTITVKHFLDNVLRSVKRQNLLGKSIKEPGFYFTKDSQQVVLVLYSDFDFASPILVQGWEFGPEIYSISKDKQTLTIDSPVVKGDVPVVLIENTKSSNKSKDEQEDLKEE